MDTLGTEHRCILTGGVRLQGVERLVASWGVGCVSHAFWVMWARSNLKLMTVWLSKSLKRPTVSAKLRIAIKLVDWVAGYDVELPHEYIFQGDSFPYDWLKLLLKLKLTKILLRSFVNERVVQQECMASFFHLCAQQHLHTCKKSRTVLKMPIFLSYFFLRYHVVLLFSSFSSRQASNISLARETALKRRAVRKSYRCGNNQIHCWPLTSSL